MPKFPTSESIFSSSHDSGFSRESGVLGLMKCYNVCACAGQFKLIIHYFKNALSFIILKKHFKIVILLIFSIVTKCIGNLIMPFFGNCNGIEVPFLYPNYIKPFRVFHYSPSLTVPRQGPR